MRELKIQTSKNDAMLKLRKVWKKGRNRKMMTKSESEGGIKSKS